MAEDIRSKIRPQLMDAMKDQVSRKLIQNWKHIKLLVPGLPDTHPTPQQMMGDPNAPEGSPERLGIAGQLIENRKASVGGVTLDLAELDAAIEKKKQEGVPAHLKAMLDSMGKINDLVPNRTSIEEITEATAKGIESQSGTGNKIWSFIKAIGKWLMSAISSVFGGGPMMSFSQALAESGAPGVGDAVRENLTALANDPSKASSRLLNMQDGSGRRALDTITDTVTDGVYRELGGTPPARPEGTTQPPLESVKPTDFDIGAIRTYISNQIKSPAGKPSLSDVIFTQLITSREEAVNNNPVYLGGSFGARQFAPSDATMRTNADRMSNTIADTIAGRISDPNFRTPDGRKLSQLTKEEFSSLMAEEVGTALTELEKGGKLDLGGPPGFRTKLADKGKDGKSHIEKVKEQVREQMMARYDEVKPALNLVSPGQTFAQNRPLPAPGELASLGVSGGTQANRAGLGGHSTPITGNAPATPAEVQVT